MYRLIGYLSKHKLFPLFGDGNNLMQPVHARDLGNAYYDVLRSKEKTLNKEYDLSGKEPIKYIDIIKCIKSNLNSNVKIISVPFGLSLLASKVYNAIFGKNAIISVEQVLRMQEDKIFSHEVATADFGYDPLAFKEGIKEEVEEYLKGVRVDFSKITYQ
jgi:nucleoside-diphosphate-sugar epimerase